MFKHCGGHIVELVRGDNGDNGALDPMLFVNGDDFLETVQVGFFFACPDIDNIKNSTVRKGTCELVSKGCPTRTVGPLFRRDMQAGLTLQLHPAPIEVFFCAHLPGFSKNGSCRAP